MGVVAGFGASDHVYVRIGVRYNSDPNTTEGISFAENVAEHPYTERWCDEVQIFHNPNARIPLAHAWLSEVAQFYYSNHERYALIRDHQVLSSMTLIGHFASHER